jgi:alanine dehydrogenase
VTLVLNNDEISQLLTVEDCLARLDETYRDLGDGRVVNRPRSDSYSLPEPEGRYVFKTMDGIVPRYGVAALRLCSDVIRWKSGPAGVTKQKLPLGPGGNWVGLVLLFSTRTGEPLAILPDGVMQRLRVACTNALGVRYMAPKEASVYALLGAGWQASGQALAIAAVRNLSEIRVYSPTREKRERLAKELSDKLGVEAHAMDDAKSAVRDADIVGAATNSVTPVVEADWLASCAHVTCIKELELSDAVLERSAQIVVHTRIGRPINYIMGGGEEPVVSHDPQEGVVAGSQSDQVKEARARRFTTSVDLTKQPNLGELVTGRVKPATDGITCFINTMGVGAQFAAVGSLVIERARERGIGREIPTEWLLEAVQPLGLNNAL